VTDWADRVLGCLLGGAVGDALGFAVEFDTLPQIRERYGPAGLTEMVDAFHPAGTISDDTQMTLFTLEGLVRARTALRLGVPVNPLAEVQHAYQRWLHTQDVPWPQAAGAFLRDHPEPDGWLVTVPELFALRAPGKTCMGALKHFAAGHPPGSPTNRLNNSKGCGGVMRAAPFALWGEDPRVVFRFATDAAAITHGHPSGFLAAGALAFLVHQLLRDVPLPEAVDAVLAELGGWPGHEETVDAMHRALAVAGQGVPTPEEVEQELGLGWVAEEALAMAVCAALVAGDDFELAMQVSINHSGDSDSVAAICGNLLGAQWGTQVLPQRWLDRLELRNVVEQLGLDAIAAFGPNPPTDPDWLRRYPVGPNRTAAAPTEPSAPEADPDPTTGSPHEPSGPSGRTTPPPTTAVPTTTGQAPARRPAPEEPTGVEQRLVELWRRFSTDPRGLPPAVALALHVLGEHLGATPRAPEPPFPAPSPVNLAQRLEG